MPIIGNNNIMTEQKYSFWIGLRKGLVHSLIFGLGVVVFVLQTSNPELFSAKIADLIQPVLGGMTVGGVVTFVINWLKNKDN